MAERLGFVAGRVAWSATLTIVALSMFETLAQMGGWLPEPVGLLALVVVGCAFVGGSQGGLVSAIIAVAFAMFEGGLGGAMFPWDERHFGRASIAAYSLPALALLVGLLRIQAQNRLAREKQARQDAELAERRYRELIEGIGAVVWEARLPDFAVEFVSRHAEQLGYPVADWIDSNTIWSKLIHPDDLQRVQAHQEMAARTGEPYETEYRIVTRSGQELWTRAIVHVVYGDNGAPRTLRGVMIDLTERRHSEERVRNDQERWLLLFDHIADLLLVHDMAGRIVEVNRAAVETLGYTRDELLTMRLDDIEEAQNAAGPATWRQLEPGDSVIRSVSYRRRDGSSFSVEVRVGLLPWGTRTLVAAVARDASERNRMEDHVRKAQRMEAIGRLAAGVAHDFNNMLTAIRGHAELVLKRESSGTAAQADLRQIMRATDRAARLTRQLLAFSRQQIFRPRVLDLDRILIEIEPMLRRVVGPDIRIDLQTSARSPIRADRGQIEQVLINLTINARDAMPEGGQLDIATSTVDVRVGGGDEPFIEPGEYALITIRDTGRGIEPAALAHLFEPFFTTQRNPSAGLGLATAYGIVKQTGGYIVPQSRTGSGTTFRVYLPTTEAMVPAEPEPGEVHVQTSGFGGSETLLIVEDEEAVRHLVARVLRKQGYHVLQASSGEQALEIAATATNPVDLLLSDIVMPGLNGRQLVQRLRAEQPGLRVILMSGYSDAEVLKHREVPPDTPFLQKPFTPAQLLTRVRDTLDNGQP
jgi:two-component system, cell cycle sensor histidine kinase and response regulator CckA